MYIPNGHNFILAALIIGPLYHCALFVKVIENIYPTINVQTPYLNNLYLFKF